jgi:hypothetical protein
MSSLEVVVNKSETELELIFPSIHDVSTRNFLTIIFWLSLAGLILTVIVIIVDLFDLSVRVNALQINTFEYLKFIFSFILGIAVPEYFLTQKNKYTFNASNQILYVTIREYFYTKNTSIAFENIQEFSVKPDKYTAAYLQTESDIFLFLLKAKEEEKVKETVQEIKNFINEEYD